MITQTLKALWRELNPVVAYPVSTLPTLTEARAVAALLVANGACAVIQPVATGYAVSKLGGAL